ncbi:undecaprenyldiphospho-muramoylpentapeptide beta-N-acetylglucosaminyltransferase [Sphingorhabdus lutea]|uniref:UDP-N-acetylglucosamine--N-acetylmuramyl-(pentapeptide) pyrophosphoryl-undecaprenol N-acetylglucosamine transferase n=1 Tax=Sphingorhabdus lutea TaxID=1913578 RepID=A0A1L3JCX9_9SPHN|nr:undecaprenyldiphospho-muramoylpentapeptide beta-N-acetylglucosaminyltransferase [Sphingorhabdus lutea]APG62972.1 undecaprenyldiphospho-muramoylpentapeptide beta-N-acetylglucosaminyltransferase [Sphingorhabdus lutea]
MTVTRHYVLSAGGTGGHVIPAYALAKELISRGHVVAFVTDDRGAKIPGLPDGVSTHILPAGRVSGGPKGWLSAARSIWAGRKMARNLYKNFEPTAVVGFGGYPALPALLAAFAENIPTIIHEQNAVLGRVNRLSARKVNAIATAYPNVQRLADKHQKKVHLVGNPVREEVLELRDQNFPPFLEEGIFRVLVTGGSQGASILSDIVPDGLSMLPLNLKRRLQVIQQCREEDIERVRDTYRSHNIPATLATYLPDLPEKIGWAHLVIARAGASTIAELSCAGRPAIFVPLPTAMDDHQRYNVAEMVDAGGATSINQAAFTPKQLAKQMQKMAMGPEALENAARRAWKCGRPFAVRELADLVESFGTAPMTKPMKITNNKNPSFGASPAMAKEVSS